MNLNIDNPRSQEQDSQTHVKCQVYKEHEDGAKSGLSTLEKVKFKSGWFTVPETTCGPYIFFICTRNESFLYVKSILLSFIYTFVKLIAILLFVYYATLLFLSSITHSPNQDYTETVSSVYSRFCSPTCL